MKKRRPQDCLARWTEDEDELVRELFRQPGGIAEIMEVTGRTSQAIRFRASRFGFRGPNNQRYVMKEKIKDPPPARTDLLKSMKCPGNGRGCGNRLWEEMVPSGYGYIAPGKFDLVCAAGHRFQCS